MFSAVASRCFRAGCRHLPDVLSLILFISAGSAGKRAAGNYQWLPIGTAVAKDSGENLK
jgi:hypothetical protein